MASGISGSSPASQPVANERSGEEWATVAATSNIVLQSLHLLSDDPETEIERLLNERVLVCADCLTQHLKQGINDIPSGVLSQRITLVKNLSERIVSDVLRIQTLRSNVTAL